MVTFYVSLQFQQKVPLPLQQRRLLVLVPRNYFGEDEEAEEDVGVVGGENGDLKEEDVEEDGEVEADVGVVDGENVDLTRGSRSLFLNAMCLNPYLPNSSNIPN